MRTSMSSLCISTLAALLTAGLGVRADTIPWTYSAASTQIFNNDTPQQTSAITFTGSSGGATGDSGIIVYNVTASSSADASAPNGFTNVPFDLKVTLTDVLGSYYYITDPGAVKSGVIDFAGTFSASNVTKSSLVPGQTSYSTVPQDIVLGSPENGFRDYQVSIASFTAPGQPGGAPGSIEAIVHITTMPPVATDPSGSGSGPSTAPEPSSLLLAALALPLLLACRRVARKEIAARLSVSALRLLPALLGRSYLAPAWLVRGPRINLTGA